MTIQKEKVMVKPMGVVAMLTLLAAGPAMANDRINVREVKKWGLTTSGELYMETQRGEKVTAGLQCQDLIDISNIESPVFSSRSRSITPGTHLTIKTTPHRYSCRVQNLDTDS